MRGRGELRGLRGACALAVVGALVLAAAGAAAEPLTKISEDKYSNSDSQHKTQVEADSFSFGNTVVALFQSGRYFSGGASNNMFSTSHDGGETWVTGPLPNTTVFEGGPWARLSDPVVAYSRKHDAWLASSLALPSQGSNGVIISRSTDGALTWSDPILIHQAPGTFYDKNWTTCDNTPSSPFYGHCYTEWDDANNGNRIKMSTSTNGGQTWGLPLNTANSASGLAGLPVVMRNGKVVVPIGSASLSSIQEFRSSNGGQSWTPTKPVAQVIDHVVAGGLRFFNILSADIDAKDEIYVVWADCRFRTGCPANDIVMTTWRKRQGWSPVTRIPIDPVGSGVDHFIPGLAVRPGTSGRSAHLALVYYFYPNANCSSSTCQLHVGFVESTDGGETWSAPLDLAGPMSLSWLPSTSSGRMVGDYSSVSWTGGAFRPVFSLAKMPVGGVFDQAIHTTADGLLRRGVNRVTAADRMPVEGARSDRRAPSPALIVN